MFSKFQPFVSIFLIIELISIFFFLIHRDSNWSPELRSNKDFVSLLQEKQFDMNEIHIAVDVYNFIDTQGEMGAKAIDLLERYEDKEFLQKILDYFNEAKLVMKTGVCEVTYVHWKHIKPWVVNTYNLKRIDRVSKLISFAAHNLLNHNFYSVDYRRQLHHRPKHYYKCQTNQANQIHHLHLLKLNENPMMSIQLE